VDGERPGGGGAVITGANTVSRGAEGFLSDGNTVKGFGNWKVKPEIPCKRQAEEVKSVSVYEIVTC
jgi:hypothetical protein